MFPVLSANGTSGYNLTNSLRFRASATAYLSRTPASATNRTTWTWSAWVKRSNIGSWGAMFSSGTLGGTSTFEYITFRSDDSLQWVTYTTSTQANLITTQVFRDPSAWYHIVVAFDSTQATSSNRVKMYVNGNQITAFSTSTYPSLNYSSFINNNQIHTIGRDNGGDYLDGYLTEVNFIDGQALTPSSFGNTNSTTGVWQPARYSGSYGTNGFYLNFNSIALTSGSNTGLGKDNSGNGNYWNTNNISVTAGATYDAMLDVPTLTSATVANYATLNPLDIPGTATIADANLKLTGGSSAWGASRTGFAMTSGKWYWEVTILSANTVSNGIDLGIANSSAITAGIGQTNKWVYNNNIVNGRKSLNGTVSAYGVTYVANDIVGIAFDADAGSITCYVNNSSQGVMASTGLPNPAFPYTEAYGSDSVAVNFGQRPFSYTPPTGYVRLNAYNLPDGTIVQGNKYMDATLYTGTNATLTVTNAGGFYPDFLWLRIRNQAYGHSLFDSVRGATKSLQSQSTNQEFTQGAGTGVNSFNSNGFTLGTDVTGNGSTNYNTGTYVAWQWLANAGSTVSNTSGTITSTVSVNTTAGFSIVTYTGNGTAGATVGHGLGVAPKMIINKSRSTSPTDWGVYYASLGNTGAVFLDLSSAFITNSGYWNNTSPTSSVFTLGLASNFNQSGQTYVSYCWAEIAGFSKFGSYTGNGSTDGPFVYTGFKPKFVMYKRSDSTGNWQIFDTSRDPANNTTDSLFANLADAETPGYNFDILSNGFKQRDNGAGQNASGGTYIYIAFASNPFKNSLAR